MKFRRKWSQFEYRRRYHNVWALYTILHHYFASFDFSGLSQTWQKNCISRSCQLCSCLVYSRSVKCINGEDMDIYNVKKTFLNIPAKNEKWLSSQSWLWAWWVATLRQTTPHNSWEGTGSGHCQGQSPDRGSRDHRKTSQRDILICQKARLSCECCINQKTRYE